MNMVKSVTVVNHNDFFNFKLDTIKFSKKFPEIFDKFKEDLNEMSFSEIVEILPFEDSIHEVTAKTNSVIITLQDGSKQKILGLELRKIFNESYCDGWAVINYNRFVYFIITIASGQCGALAIWDVEDNKCVFNYRDEFFCVEAIVYSNVHDSFIGLCEWHNFSKGKGDFFFVIDKNRVYSDVDLTKLSNITEDFKVGEKCDFVGNENAFLSIDEKNNIIMIKDNENYHYYQFMPYKILN